MNNYLIFLGESRENYRVPLHFQIKTEKLLLLYDFQLSDLRPFHYGIMFFALSFAFASKVKKLNQCSLNKCIYSHWALWPDTFAYIGSTSWGESKRHKSHCEPAFIVSQLVLQEKRTYVMRKLGAEFEVWYCGSFL